MARSVRIPTLLTLCIFAGMATGQQLEHSNNFRPAKAERHMKIGSLPAGSEVYAATFGGGGIGLQVDVHGKPSLSIDVPARVTVFDASGTSHTFAAGYDSFPEPPGAPATATVSGPAGILFHFSDGWEVTSNALVLSRKVTVEGNGNPGQGFVSSLLATTEEHATPGDYRIFSPGTMYGAPEHIDDKAAGGILAYQAGALEIREDMLPAPLFGFSRGDGSSVALLNLNPQGNSVAADFDQPQQRQVNEAFRFGAFGAGEHDDGKLALGYWFPGTMGYLDNDHLTSAATASHLRYHPIKDGLTQEYQIAFRFGEGETFHDFTRNTWRWAWNELNPAVDYHDIDQVRRSLIDMTAEQVETRDGRSGLPNSINMLNNPKTRDPKAVMGFTGKNLEAAVFFLMDAAREESPLDAVHREKALAIINSFLKLKVAPPEGEGFDMETGELQLALPHDKVVYLRSFTDDMKILLRGYEFELERGHEHPEWLAWCRTFADWLLTQQQPSGGFPRAWEPGTGKVAVAAPQSSYNAVPMLVHLTQLTGDDKYRIAAVRAAELSWTTEQAFDHFVGGTIDNPNIIDKEAATLSVEAYLALYEQGGEKKWLERAMAAADHAETYIYAWDVPMPEDARQEELHWMKGVSTVGLNVVSTSRPGLADSFMAFDVDEYAKLYKYTGDDHYLDVAVLLLHNSNNMLALPGRELNMPGPGWTSEHIGLGPPHRGRGLNRLWLPWVATCRLNGIFFTEQFDPQLFEQMKKPK